MNSRSHGLLLVDKPSGLTSHDVVSRARKYLGIKNIGHAGTLDPLATGLIILLIGEATKISDYLLNNQKSYRVKAKLGVETDSLDITGNLISQNTTDHIVMPAIRDAFMELEGTIDLPVPKFSAVKRDGKKLLERARNNEEFEPPVRPMTFFDIELLDFNPAYLVCNLSCSKGSFIRSWVHKLGQILGCGATVEELRRTHSDPYSEQQACQLKDLESNADIEECSSFISLDRCLQDWEALTVTGRDEKLILNGQVPNSLSKRLIYQQKMANQIRQPIGVRIYQASSGSLASLIELEPYQSPKIKRIFRY